LQATGYAAANPGLSVALTKSAAGSPLTATELSQYQFFVRGLLYDIQEAYLLHEEGRLDDEYWRTRAAIVLAYLAQPLARDVYARDKTMGALHSDSVRWLDLALEAHLAK
jgi:hypothetical protein